MANVTFKKVVKRYGDVTVIPGFDLEIHEGEFMVLVGPSGCGKSTALRMIAGLEEITSGEIEIDGRVVNDLPPKDRDIAMVFQSYALYPHMSVRENLAFGLKIRKTPRAEIDKLVQDAAGILGIEELLDRRPKQLSGGQRQRVAVGRAIVRKPSVFLFDEPLSNLDAKLRVQMRAEISKLHARLKTTTVYVTHDQVEAMTMGNRICVMKDGELQQVGTPLELYKTPDNLFVANFIGTPPMNFVKVKIDGDTMTAEGFELPVPERLRAPVKAHATTRAILGLRPENLIDLGEQARGQVAKLKVIVDVIEPLGHEVIVHGRSGDDLLVAKIDPERMPQLEQELELQVELDFLHLFDIQDEKRLT